MSAPTHIEDAYQLFVALVEDVRAASARRLAEDTPLNRRDHVRSVFAYIEGHVFQMKQYALAIHRTYGLGFSDAEVALLTEKTHNLDDRGHARSHQRFMRLPQNLRFGLRVFARANNVDHTPDVSGSGWSAFKGALQVRNRLTHPKVVSDLNVSDADMQAARDAFMWFLDETKIIFKGAQPNR